MKTEEVRINKEIRAPELRVILPDGTNLDVIKTSEALSKAMELGLDLVEISPNAVPPVAKITDFGKWKYQEEKKEKERRAGSKSVETKNIQVKIGTDESGLGLKARMASKFLSEGHRVKIDLYLRGRAKYLKPEFHKARLMRLLDLVSVPYKIADEFKSSPKGLSVVIERDKTKG